MEKTRVGCLRFIKICSRSFHSNSHLNCRVGIVGMPFNKGQPKQGVDSGPTYLRATGFIEDLRRLGYSLKDYGDISHDEVQEDRNAGVVKNCSAVASANKTLSETVQRILRDKSTCVVLGGDHSLAMGSVHGHAQVYPDLSLLWIDAHADINTATTTNSGNMHGMSASFHFRELEFYNQSLRQLDWLKPSIGGKDAAYIGLRDVEPLEKLILEKLGIKIFSMHDVDKLGIEETLARALDSINPTGQKSLHVSYDIDALDVTVAPSTGTAVPGGLTLREGLLLAENIYKTGNLRVLDLVEVNPTIGTPSDVEKTLFAAKQILMTAFGSSRAGDIPAEMTEIPGALPLKYQQI